MLGPANDEPYLDGVLLAEIELLTDLVIAAQGREVPLGQNEIDSVLGVVGEPAAAPVLPRPRPDPDLEAGGSKRAHGSPNGVAQPDVVGGMSLRPPT